MLPDIKKPSGIGKTVQIAFGGYDRRPDAADGTFSWTDGMTATRYPLLSNRQKRKSEAVDETTQSIGILAMGDALVQIDDGSLYYNDIFLCVLPVMWASQMVLFGRKILFPEIRVMADLQYPPLGHVEHVSDLPDEATEGDAYLVGHYPECDVPIVYLYSNGEWTEVGPFLQNLEEKVTGWPMVFRDGTYQDESAAANTIALNPNLFTMESIDQQSVPVLNKLFKAGDAVKIECAHKENCKTLIVREVTETELRFYENSFYNYVGRHTVGAEGLRQGRLYEVRGWFREDRGGILGGDVKKYFILPSGVNLDEGDYIEYVYDDSQMNPEHFYYQGAVMRCYRSDGTEISSLTDIEPSASYDESQYTSGPTPLLFEAVDQEGMEWGDLAPTISRAWPEGLENLFTNSNRVWGWTGHTIRASKLGDPSNWEFFDGTAEDCWALDVHTPEPFTAGMSAHGYPTFWTEKTRFRIYGSTPEAFQLVEQDCHGVREGCAASLASIDGTLYYVSRAGVMQDTGTVPACVSAALGDLRLQCAAGAATGVTYWVSGQDEAGNWHTFVLDTRNGVWIRDCGRRFFQMAAVHGTLYALEATMATEPPWFRFWTFAPDESGEDAVRSTVITNDYTVSRPNRKRVHRVQLRVLLKDAATLTVSIRYDDGEWVRVSTLATQTQRKASFYLPVLPRRCDHFALKLEGVGDWELHSLALEVRTGSAMF